MKKLFSCLLVICSTALVLGGCTLQSRVGSAADTVTANYCTKPKEERAVIRQWIDRATTPNQIRIICAADVVQEAQATATRQ